MFFKHLERWRLVSALACATMLTCCVGEHNRSDLVAIVQPGSPPPPPVQYCHIFYGPKIGAEASCGERMKQCQELLPGIVARLQTIEAPRRSVKKCSATAREDLDERRRSDSSFSLLFRSIATETIRDYDGEAACLSKLLARTDIPSVRATPAPPDCDTAPTATPSAEELGPQLACSNSPATPDCRGEEDARSSIASYDGKVSFSLRKRCSALAKVDTMGRPSPFRWSRYASCLKRSTS